MQYSVLKDTILSTVENLDAAEQYIICQDDDEDEAFEDYTSENLFPQQQTALLGATT